MVRPVHCAMRHGITSTVMVYHWTMRQHGASKDSPDLPTAHVSDLPTLNNVSAVEKSHHTDIWRHSMHQEFNGLLQAGTFAPAPA